MVTWLMFAALGLIWGSSFLLIKIGVRELDPVSLVSARLGLAALAFSLAYPHLYRRFPRDARSRLGLILVALLNTAIPFTLITWGEQSIDSSVAGVLNGTTPLFSLIIAHLVLHDDRITAGKMLGLVAGFAGIVLLATRNVEGGHVNSLEGQLAVLVAALGYAIAAVYIRRYLRHVEPMMVAGSSLVVGAITMVCFTLLTVHPLPVISTLSTDVILAVVVLGVLNTFIAYLLYFRVLNTLGASRATMVTYLVSPVSLFFGALLGNELIDSRLVLGAALIVGGIVFANMRRRPATPPPVSGPLPAALPAESSQAADR